MHLSKREIDEDDDDEKTKSKRANEKLLGNLRVHNAFTICAICVN